MSIPRVLALVALLAALVFVGFKLLWPVSDQDRIRQTIDGMVEGAEDGDLGAVLTPVSEAYADDDGLNKDALRGLVFREFRRRGSIAVQRGPMTIAVDGDQATATFDALLLEGAEGAALPIDGDAMTFTVELRREAGDWRVVSHDRRPLEEGWRLPAEGR